MKELVYSQKSVVQEAEDIGKIPQLQFVEFLKPPSAAFSGNMKPSRARERSSSSPIEPDDQLENLQIQALKQVTALHRTKMQNTSVKKQMPEKGSIQQEFEQGSPLLKPGRKKNLLSRASIHSEIQRPLQNDINDCLKKETTSSKNVIDDLCGSQKVIDQTCRRHSTKLCSIQLKSSLIDNQQSLAQKKNEKLSPQFARTEKFSQCTHKSSNGTGSQVNESQIVNQFENRDYRLQHLSVGPTVIIQPRRISNSTSSSKFQKQGSSEGIGRIFESNINVTTTGFENRHRRQSSGTANSSLYTPAFPHSNTGLEYLGQSLKGRSSRFENSPLNRNDISALDRYLLGSNGNYTQPQQIQIDLVDLGQSLEHSTTFGPIISNKMQQNKCNRKQSVNDLYISQKTGHSFSNATSYEAMIVQNQDNQISKPIQVAEQSQLRYMPKFMEYDKDGKLKMKRELKLAQSKSQTLNIEILANETSSFCTDSSMIDVSIETDNYRQRKNEQQQPKRNQQEKSEVVKNKCEKKQRSDQNEKQYSNSHVFGQEQQYKNYSKNLMFPQVSETDEELSKSHNTKNTGRDDINYSQDLNHSKRNGSPQHKQSTAQLHLAQHQQYSPVVQSESPYKSRHYNDQSSNVKRSRHSMLVQVRKGDGQDEIEQHLQVSKLFTQLYKFDNDSVISSLLGGRSLNLIPEYNNQLQQNEISQMSDSQKLQLQLQNQTFLQSPHQLQRIILQQRQKNKSQITSSPNQLLIPPQMQLNPQQRNHNKPTYNTGKARSIKGIKTEDQITSRRGGGAQSGYPLNRSSNESINNDPSQLRSLTSSQVIQQNQSRRRLTQSPAKINNNRGSEIATEIVCIEQLYKNIFFPWDTESQNQPIKNFLLQSNKEPNFTSPSGSNGNFYDANTIKEATEDLEQSSKGGSIAFRSKGLFFTKAASIVSQKEKPTEQTSIYLGIDNVSSPQLKQSLSLNQSRKITQSNIEQDDKMLADSLNLDEISNLNIKLTSMHKDKRFSNPDPNDRKIRRLETSKLNQDPNAVKALFKQLTQPPEQKSTQNFTVNANEEMVVNESSKDFYQVTPEKHDLKKPKTIESANETNEFLHQGQSNSATGRITNEKVIQYSSPSNQSPLTAQFRQSKKSGCRVNNRQVVEQPLKFYKYSHGYPSAKVDNLIRGMKKVVKRFSGTPDGIPVPQLKNILELTRKKVFLEHIEESMQNCIYAQASIKELRQNTGLILKEIIQKTQQELSSQYKNPDDSTTSNGCGIRLSFETNNVNPVIFTDGYNYYQDDFTPSHCYVLEPVSSSSDLFSSNNLFSQLEPFNPNNYEMEPIALNSSDASQQLTSLNQTSTYNWKNRNENQYKHHQEIKSVKYLNKKNLCTTQSMQQSKFLPDNFTQVNMLLQDKQQQAKSQINASKVININSNLVEQTFSVDDSLQDRFSNITSLKAHPHLKLEPHNGEQLTESPQDFKRSSARVFGGNDIILVQPSRRHTTSNSQNGSSQHSACLIQGTIDKTNTARTNVQEVKEQNSNSLQLHPDLKKFLNENQKQKLEACIPRPLSSTTIYREESELSKSMTQGQRKILESVSKSVNKRLVRGITSATDAQYADRRRQDNPQRSLISVSQQQSPKKPHTSITTTSLVSSKQRGITRINQYQMISRLGAGKYAKVKLCVDLNTNQYYAAKIINKVQLQKKAISKTQNAFASVQQEMAIMKNLDHPHLVKLYEIIDDPKEKKLYLITEFVKKGNLEKKVRQSPQWLQQTENDVMRKIFRQLIQALEYCHEVVKILHRDIKPENILIDENDDMKLADFGVSSILPSDGTDITSSNAGSAIFFSPEACQGQQYHGKLTDYWACGVTLYFMCTGRYPFMSNDYHRLFNQIQYAEPEFPPHLKDTSLQNLISGILQKRSKDRLTLQQIKQHPWVIKNGVLPPIPDIQSYSTFLHPSKEEVNNVMNKVKSHIKYNIRRKIHDISDNKSVD